MKMTRIMKVALSIVILLTGGLLKGQEQLSLSQALEKGLRNNYGIQIAEKNAEIAAGNNSWAIAGRYPTIDLNLNVNNGFVGIKNPASFTRELNSFSTGVVPGVVANWVLFDGYRVRFTKQQLEQLERLGQGNVEVAVENTIENIILSYYTALVEKERLDVRNRVLNLSRDRLEYEKIRQEYGQSSTFDVLQTQDAYINDSTSYLIQVATYDNAMRNLNLAMGIDQPGAGFALTDQLSYVAPDYNLTDLQGRMAASNRTLQNLYIDREVARINTEIQQSALKPSISVQGGASYSYNRNLFGTAVFSSGDERSLNGLQNSTINGFVNFTATYNLFDGGVRKRQIENAKVGELTAQLSIEDYKRMLNTELANSLALYNNQKQLVEVTDQLVNNAQRNLEIAEERFRGGLINAFDYRTIQLGYINATQSRLQAIFNLKTTETELIRLIGGLVR